MLVIASRLQTIHKMDFTSLLGNNRKVYTWCQRFTSESTIKQFHNSVNLLMEQWPMVKQYKIVSESLVPVTLISTYSEEMETSYWLLLIQ